MNNMPDFLKEVEDEGITQESMTNLATLIEEYDKAAMAMARAEKAFDITKKHFNELTLETIPEFLLKHGITKMKLEDGREVNIKEDISATVTDEWAFREFLRERKEDDIIKIKYAFARMEHDKITILSDFLMDKDYDFEIDEKIHPATKKKYFKEFIKDNGREALPDWVTIYDIRQAKIK